MHSVAVLYPISGALQLQPHLKDYSETEAATEAAVHELVVPGNHEMRFIMRCGQHSLSQVLYNMTILY